MEVSIHFKNAIQEYVDENIKNTFENKNIDDCIKFVLNTVQKSNINGFTDNEIFEMVNDYYTNENIEVGDYINYKVVVNRTIELTDEEKKEIKDKALNDLYQKELEKNKRKKVVTSSNNETQATLF